MKYLRYLLGILLVSSSVYIPVSTYGGDYTLAVLLGYYFSSVLLLVVGLLVLFKPVFAKEFITNILAYLN